MQLENMLGSVIAVSIEDPAKSVDVILTAPDGEEYILPGTMVPKGNGEPTLVY